MVSITATDAGGMTPPRVALSLAWDIDADVTIVRIDPDGTAHPVRGCEPLRLTNTVTWSGYDYEAPLNADVLYEASADSGTRRVSGTVRCTATAFYPNDQGWSTARGAVWLRHLTIPDLSMPVDLANAESPSYAQTRTVVPVLNRAAPVVLTDARRKTPTTTLDIRTWSLEEAARLRELLADNSVLLLDVPAPERWGITHWWVTVADVTEERLWQEWAPFEGRVFHLPVEVVDRPPGGTVYSGRSYWSAQRGVATYYQWQRMYGSYAALATQAPASSGGTGGGSGAGGGGSGTASNARTGTIHGTTHATGARSGRARRTGTIHGTTHATGVRSGRARRTGAVYGAPHFTGAPTGSTTAPSGDSGSDVALVAQTAVNVGLLANRVVTLSSTATVEAGQYYTLTAHHAVSGGADATYANLWILAVPGEASDADLSAMDPYAMIYSWAGGIGFQHGGAAQSIVVQQTGVQFDTGGLWTFALYAESDGSITDATAADVPRWLTITEPVLWLRVDGDDLGELNPAVKTVTLSGTATLDAAETYKFYAHDIVTTTGDDVDYATLNIHLFLGAGSLDNASLLSQGQQIATSDIGSFSGNTNEVLLNVDNFAVGATGVYTAGVALSADHAYAESGVNLGWGDFRALTIRRVINSPHTTGITPSGTVAI